MVCARKCVIGAAAALCVGAGTANADVIASVTSNNMTGNFVTTTPTTGVFTATATNTAGRRTNLNTSRLIPVVGNADFPAGFIGNPVTNGLANITMTINTNTSNNTGTGAFTVTDVDGSRITGNISGNWMPGLFFNFSGAVSNVTFVGTSFDSPTGSWSMLFPGGPLFDGAIVDLSSSSDGTYAGIVNSVTQTNIQITPAPGTLGLLSLGGLLAARRRRVG